MARQNIYTTLSVASVMPPPLIDNLMDFLINNRSFILSPEKRNEAFKTRFPGHSLISDLVHRMTILGKDQAYSLIRLPSKTVSLREAVDMTFIPNDILQMKDITSSSTKTLSLLPELDNKLVINVTDITKSNGDFSDVTQFHNRVVRDFLSRSFYTSTGNVWLSPTLVRYIAKVYSMTIGGKITRQYGLSSSLQSLIQTVFCAFFAGKMTSQDVTVDFLKAHGKHMSLPDVGDLNQILAFTEDTLGHKVPASLEEVCRVIDAYGHDQLKGTHGSRITRPTLNHQFVSMGLDGNTSVIALEYPPYFAFLTLLVLSNVRIGLAFPMKNMNVIKEGHDVFEQLIKSPIFFNNF